MSKRKVHQPPPVPEEEATLPSGEGPWQEPVEDLIWWLRDQGYWTEAAPLEQALRSALPAAPREGDDWVTRERQAERLALFNIHTILSHLTDWVPRRLGQEQAGVPLNLCNEAIRRVRHRMDELGGYEQERDRIIASVTARKRKNGSVAGGTMVQPQGLDEPPACAQLEDDYVASISGAVQRKLLRAVNGKGNVAISAVLKAVYGTKDEDKLPALLKAKDRVNAKLATDKKGYVLQQKGKTFLLSPLQ